MRDQRLATDEASPCRPRRPTTASISSVPPEPMAREAEYQPLRTSNFAFLTKPVETVRAERDLLVDIDWPCRRIELTARLRAIKLGDRLHDGNSWSARYSAPPPFRGRDAVGKYITWCNSRSSCPCRAACGPARRSRSSTTALAASMNASSRLMTLAILTILLVGDGQRSWRVWALRASSPAPYASARVVCEHAKPGDFRQTGC